MLQLKEWYVSADYRLIYDDAFWSNLSGASIADVVCKSNDIVMPPPKTLEYCLLHSFSFFTYNNIKSISEPTFIPFDYAACSRVWKKYAYLNKLDEEKDEPKDLTLYSNLNKLLYYYEAKSHECFKEPFNKFLVDNEEEKENFNHDDENEVGSHENEDKIKTNLIDLCFSTLFVTLVRSYMCRRISNTDLFDTPLEDLAREIVEKLSETYGQSSLFRNIYRIDRNPNESRTSEQIENEKLNDQEADDLRNFVFNQEYANIKQLMWRAYKNQMKNRLLLVFVKNENRVDDFGNVLPTSSNDEDYLDANAPLKPISLSDFFSIMISTMAQMILNVNLVLKLSSIYTIPPPALPQSCLPAKMTATAAKETNSVPDPIEWFKEEAASSKIDYSFMKPKRDLIVKMIENIINKY